MGDDLDPGQVGGHPSRRRRPCNGPATMPSLTCRGLQTAAAGPSGCRSRGRTTPIARGPAAGRHHPSNPAGWPGLGVWTSRLVASVWSDDGRFDCEPAAIRLVAPPVPCRTHPAVGLPELAPHRLRAKRSGSSGMAQPDAAARARGHRIVVGAPPGVSRARATAVPRRRRACARGPALPPTSGHPPGDRAHRYGPATGCPSPREVTAAASGATI